MPEDSTPIEIFLKGETLLTRIGDKVGGANSAGEHGGIYSFKDSSGSDKKILLKTENPENDISEFLASRFFAETAPTFGAQVEIIPIEGSKPYIGSIFFDDYADLSREVTTERGFKKDGRVFAAGTMNMLTSFMRVKMLGSDGKPKYSGFSESMATSLLIGDFDVHTGNVGAVGKEGEKKKLVRIDFAAAFAKLIDEIHPDSHLMHPFGLGPTNHFREYPRDLRISVDMAESCFSVSSNKSLSKVILESLDEVGEHYEVEDLKAFAKKIGMDPKSFKKSSDKKDIIDGLKSYVDDKMSKRQQSLKNFASEIAIAVCFDNKGELKDKITMPDGSEKSAQAYLNECIKRNPEYFEKISEGKEKIHFRGKDHKKMFGMFDFTGLSVGAILKKSVQAKLSSSYKEVFVAESMTINPLSGIDEATIKAVQGSRKIFEKPISVTSNPSEAKETTTKPIAKTDKLTKKIADKVRTSLEVKHSPKSLAPRAKDRSLSSDIRSR